MSYGLIGLMLILLIGTAGLNKLKDAFDSIQWSDEDTETETGKN